MGAVGAAFDSSAAAKAGRKIRDQINKAKDQLNAGLTKIEPFRQAARDLIGEFDAADPAAALNQLRAFSGASGPQAQKEAFAQFEESPGVEFLRERGIRGINRQLAAGGNLGSGSRLEALTQFSQNLAKQDLQRQLGLLSGVELREQDLLAQRVGREDIEAGDILENQRIKAAFEANVAIPLGQLAQQRQQAKGQIITGAIGDVVSLASFAAGGPAGAALTSGVGQGGGGSTQQLATSRIQEALGPIQLQGIGG